MYSLSLIIHTTFENKKELKENLERSQRHKAAEEESKKKAEEEEMKMKQEEERKKKQEEERIQWYKDREEKIARLNVVAEEGTDIEKLQAWRALDKIGGFRPKFYSRQAGAGYYYIKGTGAFEPYSDMFNRNKRLQFEIKRFFSDIRPYFWG